MSGLFLVWCVLSVICVCVYITVPSLCVSVCCVGVTRSLLLNCLTLFALQRITYYHAGWCVLINCYYKRHWSECKIDDVFGLFLLVYAILFCLSMVTWPFLFVSFSLCLSVLLKWGWLQCFITWSAQRSCSACGRGFHRSVIFTLQMYIQAFSRCETIGLDKKQSVLSQKQ